MLAGLNFRERRGPTCESSSCAAMALCRPRRDPEVRVRYPTLSSRAVSPPSHPASDLLRAGEAPRESGDFPTGADDPRVIDRSRLR